MSERISLEEKILNDYKKALKEGKKTEIACLRLLRSEIKNEQIEKKDALTDDEIIQILRRCLKKEVESLEYFIRGNRTESITQTRDEIDIIKRYLPLMLSSEEIGDIARKIVTEKQLKGLTGLGPAMKLIMNELKGRADGTLVNQIVRKILEENCE